MEDTQRDNNPLQLWCTMVTEESSWGRTPTPDNYSWSLEQGTLKQIEASLWEQCCDAFTGGVEDEDEDVWCDAVSSAVSSYRVPYDPTDEDHQSIKGFEDIRPEHHEWKIRDTKRKVEALEKNTDRQRLRIQDEQRKLALRLEALDYVYEGDKEKLLSTLQELESK